MVILDRGFFAIKSIIDMKKRVVYESEFIKKRGYWPKFINGKVTKLYMT